MLCGSFIQTTMTPLGGNILRYTPVLPIIYSHFKLHLIRETGAYVRNGP